MLWIALVYSTKKGDISGEMIRIWKEKQSAQSVSEQRVFSFHMNDMYYIYCLIDSAW